jgi:hypothetical protein
MASGCGIQRGTNAKDQSSSADSEWQSYLKLFPMQKDATELIPNSPFFPPKNDKIADHLSNPRRMLLGSDDRIYVSDSNQHSIFILNPTGSISKRVGSSEPGPGQLMEPSFLAEVSKGKIAVVDSNKLRILFFDKDGIFSSSFRLFKPCSSMAADCSGHIYASFLDLNGNSTSLIDIFDEFGNHTGQMGSRLDGGSPLFNDVEISVADGIYVAWRTYPLIRKYSKSGLLLFEHHLNYGPLAKFGEHNRYSVEEHGKIFYQTVFWKIWGESDCYYLLIGYPRLQILRIDRTGRIIEIYWQEVPIDFYVSDFCIKRERGSVTAYVLEKRPVARIRKYLLRRNASNAS